MQSPPKILLLDDFPDSCEAVATWLELEGFSASCAETVEAALEALARERFDAVLMEPHLRSGPASRVAVAARAGTGGQVLLVSMSASGRAGDHTSYEPTLFHHNFVKPVPLQQLGRLLATELLT